MELLKRTPGHKGDKGRSTTVVSNLYKFKTLDFKINVYHVVLKGDGTDLKGKRIRFMDKIYQEHRVGLFQNGSYAYDGDAKLLSSKKLDFSGQKEIHLELGLARGHKLEVHLTEQTAMSSNKDFTSYLNGSSIKGFDHYEMINNLNVVLNFFPYEHVHTNRGFFDVRDSSPVGKGLQILTGIKTIVKPGTQSLFLNVDTAFSVFYDSGNALDVVMGILNANNPSHVKWGGRDIDYVSKCLRGVMVETRHGDKHRKYKINKLLDISAAKCTFKDKDGNESSVEKYLSQVYNIRLNHPDWPCLEVGSHKSILPLEICWIVAGQKYSRKLDREQTDKMLRIASKKPNERFNTIQNGVENILVSPAGKSYSDNWGLAVSTTPQEVPARILPAPAVFYDKKTVDAGRGSWNLRDMRLTNPALIQNWAVLSFTRRSDERTIRDFIGTFVRTSRNSGLRFADSNPPIIFRSPDEDQGMALFEAYKEAKPEANSPVFVLVVLPDKGTLLYKRVKIAADTHLGFLTQCVVLSNLRKGPSYCANLALKVNMKLGGFNQFVKWEGDTAFMTDPKSPLMVLGLDLNHSQSRPSVAALCASTDQNATTYVTDVKLVRPKENKGPQDRIEPDILIQMFKNVLRAYFSKNGYKPKRFIFYRDGVSDGQFQAALDTEVNALKTAYAQLESEDGRSDAPKITYIVVQKRHNVRFHDRNNNVQAGTLIDAAPINHPQFFDFYLTSHSGRLGTSRPRHYYVLYDENNMSANEIELMTHHLCFNYGRSTAAISVTPPIYYADLLAKRASLYLESDIMDNSSIVSGNTAKDDLATNTRLWEEYLEKFVQARTAISEKMYFV